MTPRMDYFAKAPELMRAVRALNQAVAESGLEKSLLHLVKLRASQINGCSYCVDMHSREARQDGETEQRLYLVAAWKESPLFTERERAAFAWVEAVTLIADDGVSDALTGVPMSGLQPKHFRLCSPTGKIFDTAVDTCSEARWEKADTAPSGCYALSVVVKKEGGGKPLEWLEGEFYPFGVQVRFSDDTKEIHMGQTVVRIQSLGK